MGRLKRPLQSLSSLLGVSCLVACAPSSSSDTRHPKLDLAASLTLSCSGCHAQNGTAIVSLNGLPADYIERRMLEYKEQSRGTSVMHRLARGYSTEQIQAIAAELGAPQMASEPQ